jgi:hypothetical protein
MNENRKLTEAKFFLSKMREVCDNPAEFEHYLSAFLSAARSVLQYALEEAKTRPGGQSWYDGQVSGDSALRFFKDKRDVNIHVKPLAVMQEVTLTEKVTLHISESLYIESRGPDGTLEVCETHTEPSGATIQRSESTVKVKFTFPDWAGEHDVVGVCQDYLDRLTVFVASAIGVGIITR